jgi:transposase
MQHTHKLSLSREEREKRRFKAGKLFKKGISQAEVARRFHVTPTAVTQWHQAWEGDKRHGLESRGKTGKASKLTEAKRKIFKAAVLKGPLSFGFETDLWTLPRLASVMKKVTGVKFTQSYTWEIVRSLGFTPQKPQVLAKERDEQAIREWKRNRLPGLKKMGSNSWVLHGF